MTFIQKPQLEALPHPFFIVTEGMGDARFIDELLQFRAIANCSVGCPSNLSSQGTGKAAFPKYLASIQTARTRVDSLPLKGVLIVADANGNAAESFDSAVAALRDATFPAPSRAFSIEVVEQLRMAIYLVPGEGETGTLEHILLKAVFEKSPHLEECLEHFSTCTGGLKSGMPNSLAKMRMSALAAAFCEDNPWCSVNTMFRDRNNPVPVDSDHFENIREFLAKFAS